MKQIQIPKKLYNEIKEYCSYNDIKGVNHHIVHLIELGFNFMRYGTSPFDNQIPQFINEEKKVALKEISLVENSVLPLENSVLPLENSVLPVVEVKKKKEKKKGITIIKND